MDEAIDLFYQLRAGDEAAQPGPPGAGRTYLADLRLVNPGAGSGESPVNGRVRLPEALSLSDPVAYGAALTDALFADPDLLACYRQALNMAANSKPERKVRLQLIIAEDARELHSLRWETLIDPYRRDGALDAQQPPWLAASPRVVFSRFLGAREPWDVQLAPRDRIRALVAVASPAGLRAQGDPDAEDDDGETLPALDVPGELGRARAGFGVLPIVPLASGDPAGTRVTLDAIMAKLAEGEGFQILYLACHGRFDRAAGGQGETLLLLEQEDGSPDLRPGGELVERICNLVRRPLLVVLAVCQSAGTGNPAQARGRDDLGALAALGPRLVREGGVAAVLAMQGRVLMSTAGEFMQRFFAGLADDGRVDVAAALARGAISRAPDRWMPVLFTRLQRGYLWYARGSGNPQNDEEYLADLATALDTGKCLPFIGPGVARRIIGSPREIAQALTAGSEAVYLSQVDDLAQIAQVLGTRGERARLDTSYAEQRLRLTLARCRDSLDAGPRGDAAAWAVIAPPGDGGDLLQRALALLALCGYPRPPELDPGVAAWRALTAEDRLLLLDRLTEAIGRNLRPDDPHRILARRRLPVYVTTRPDRLLHGAILAEFAADPAAPPPPAAGPVSDVFRWCDPPEEWPPEHWRAAHTATDGSPPFADSVFAREKFIPRPERPLIYHLFGRYDMSYLLLLTEDDFFEYMLAMGAMPAEVVQEDRWSNAVPTIAARMVSQSLLFLGFQVDDWDFRVLFRSLLSQKLRLRKSQQRNKKRSIAVQITPEGRSPRPEAARKYFQQYYRTAEVDVYWGDTSDLIGDLP